jgi:hypothetical protein
MADGSLSEELAELGPGGGGVVEDGTEIGGTFDPASTAGLGVPSAWFGIGVDGAGVAGWAAANRFAGSFGAFEKRKNPIPAAMQISKAVGIHFFI